MSLIHTQYQRMRGFSIGDRSRIFPHVTLKGKIIIGKKSKIKHYSMLLASGGYIKIGDNCTINPFCILYGHGGLDIGNGVRIAAHTVIIPANHEMHPDLPIFRQPVNKIGIVIEDDVWLGAGVRVLDGGSYL